MIMVGNVGGPAAAARTVRRSGAGGAFAVPMSETGATAEAARLEGASAVMLGGMLGLQEDELPEVKDRRARRHGQAILQELARLQRALLGGTMEEGSLARLAALTEMVPEAADPSLGALVQSVALRAQIELARRNVPVAGMA
jgi:hypothetical protein